MINFSAFDRLAQMRHRGDLLYGILVPACIILFGWLSYTTSELKATQIQLESARTRHLQIADLASQYKSLKNAESEPRPSAQSPDKVLRLLTQSGKAANIPFSSLQSAKKDQISVTIEDIEYTDFLDWIITLRQRHELKLSKVVVDATDSEGRVNVRLSITVQPTKPIASGQYNA